MNNCYALVLTTLTQVSSNGPSLSSFAALNVKAFFAALDNRSGAFYYEVSLSVRYYLYYIDYYGREIKRCSLSLIATTTKLIDHSKL